MKLMRPCQLKRLSIHSCDEISIPIEYMEMILRILFINPVDSLASPLPSRGNTLVEPMSNTQATATQASGSTLTTTWFIPITVDTSLRTFMTT